MPNVSLRDAYGRFTAIKKEFTELPILVSARIAGSPLYVTIPAYVVATSIG